jgi:hypothetical protein
MSQGRLSGVTAALSRTLSAQPTALKDLGMTPLFTVCNAFEYNARASGGKPLRLSFSAIRQHAKDTL